MMSPALLDTLAQLGDYQGPRTVATGAPAVKAAVRRFQLATGLKADGIAGPITQRKLETYQTALALTPLGFQSARQWRFTRYYVAEERGYAAGTVPILAPAGGVLARVSPAFFAKAALEGSAIMRDGRLINVSGGWAQVNPADYAGVVRIAEANDWLPRKSGYAGIRAREASDGTWTATHALTFNVVTGDRRGVGYGAAGGRACEPFRTAATDCGAHPSSDPAFRLLSGVIPRGTRFWILEFAGFNLPDKTVHDGWWTANDSGGGIEGNQCDLFVGTAGISKSATPWPVASGYGYIWFPGIEARIPPGYSFGA